MCLGGWWRWSAFWCLNQQDTSFEEQVDGVNFTIDIIIIHVSAICD